jgi:hypothetical protein
LVFVIQISRVKAFAFVTSSPIGFLSPYSL